MSGQHAFLAPSFAPVWGHCSAAPSAAIQVPQYDTPETIEGTAAHWVVSEALTLWRDQAPHRVDASQWLGRTDPAGVLVTEDMTEAAQVMIDDVIETCAPFGCNKRLLVEQRVHMTGIHEHNWGTLDAAFPLIDRGVIYQWDYKHGHRDVEAVGNLQLVDYLRGLVEMYGIDGHQQQNIKVVIRIVHPRAYHSLSGPISEWVCTLADVRAYWNQLEHQAGLAVTAPEYRPGLHCRDCPAVGRCPSARKAGYSAISYVERGLPLDTMSSADMAYERRILESGLTLVKSRLEALEADLRSRVEQGDVECGLALQAAPGRVKWTVPPSQAIALGQLLGGDFAKQEVITPTQARKALPADRREAFDTATAGMTTRSAGQIKLVPADGTTAARAFKRQQQEH